MARKKKKKLSIKKISRFIISIIIVFTICIFISNYNNIKNSYLSKKTGYKKETIEVFLEDDIYKKIENKKYSKTLEAIINTEFYKEKYLNDYLEIATDTFQVLQTLERSQSPQRNKSKTNRRSRRKRSVHLKIAINVLQLTQSFKRT